MLLDSEPKPLSSDIEIKIPSKDKPHACRPGRSAGRRQRLARQQGRNRRRRQAGQAGCALAAVAAIAAPPAVAAVKLDGAKPEADSKADAKLKPRPRRTWSPKTRPNTTPGCARKPTTRQNWSASRPK
jgi:DedD protein